MSRSATELIKLVHSKAISSEEIVKEAVLTAKKIEPSIHSLIHFDPKQPVSKGPLGGIPIVISDALSLQNTPLTWGSLLFKDHISKQSGEEVQRLIDDGATILGKGNISEFGLSFETANALMPPTKNPLNTLMSPGGGASGVAAAIAAGIVPWGVGTDVSGALRLGASCMGLLGMIATRGRVPIVRRHLLPYTEQMFYRKGPLARTPQDLALLLNHLAGTSPNDPCSSKELPPDYTQCLQKKPPKFKIAASLDLGFIPVHPEVKEVFEKTLAKLANLGHTIEEAPIRLSPDLLAHFKDIFATDRYLLIGKLLGDSEESEKKLLEQTLHWMRIGGQVSGVRYALALTFLGKLQEAFEKLFTSYDLLVTPAISTCVWPLGEHPETGLDPDLGLWAFLLPFNMSGHPSLVFPGGKDSRQMPVGMQFCAGRFQEEQLLQAVKEML